ncbi:MAG: type II toxin-antitoxin system VapB family antitoxin [Bacteroidia bacterium]
MTDIQLYTKLSELPLNLKAEVADFIDFLIQKSKKQKGNENMRVAGKAKGLIKMKANFDEPLDDFKEYL